MDWALVFILLLKLLKLVSSSTFIEVPLQSQNKRAVVYMCVKGIFTIITLYLESVTTVWYCLFFIIFFIITLVDYYFTYFVPVLLYMLLL